MVIPVGDRQNQDLQVIRRHNGKIVTHVSTSCRFVPLLGREGWQEQRMNQTLELSPAQMRELGYRVVDLIAEHFAQGRDHPVGRRATRPSCVRHFLVRRHWSRLRPPKFFRAWSATFFQTR